MNPIITSKINLICAKDISTKKEIDFEKQVDITSESGVVFAEVVKTIYISRKSYYKEKMKLRKTN